MRAHGVKISAFIICALTASAGMAQLAIPQIVALPDEDFLWPWGEVPGIDDRNRPGFTVRGVERAFQCKLTGDFKPGSRMRDFYNQREFEQSLNANLYFIQEAVTRLNDLYLSNDLDWALLDCVIPESVAEEDELQEKIDRALERAERQRERRRARAADDDD